MRLSQTAITSFYIAMARDNTSQFLLHFRLVKTRTIAENQSGYVNYINHSLNSVSMAGQNRFIFTIEDLINE